LRTDLYLVKDFVDCIRINLFKGEDGLRALEVALAAYEETKTPLFPFSALKEKEETKTPLPLRP
jgi:hypothetical protein